ncbi:MAG: sterol desaturase family protein [Myxococcota bacterium]|nr:sterol desaturase family protein [Myxococcota bacterium]
MEALLEQLEAGGAWVASTLAWAVLAPLSSTSQYHWPYLLSFLLLGAGSVTWYAGRALGPRALLARLFPRQIYLHPSARIDYKIYLLNQLFLPASAALHLAALAFVAGAVVDLLTRTVGERQVPPLDGWQLAALGGVLFVGRDFGAWLNHWLHHKTPCLWPYHKLHHSAEVLTPITLYREHPVFYLLNGQIKAVTIGIPMGVIFYGFTGGADPVLITSFQLVFMAYVFAGAHLRHSHLWLSYGPVLSRLLISPAQHQVHHSALPQHRDRNFGVTLAIWDWIFGTLYVPKERESFPLGLADAPAQPHATVLRGYLLPFAESARALRARPAKRGAASISPGRQAG